MAEFYERLNEALEKRNMRASELSKLSGISEGSISQYRRGTFKANQPNIKLLANALRVSIPWLMGADVPMEKRIEVDIFTVPNIVPMPETEPLPVIGTIACGEPILAEENIEEYIDVASYIKGDFCLRCKGDSMINARIHDGDIAVIKQQPSVENGEIAAVLIDDEATLKRVSQTNNIIILKAENPEFQDIIITAEDSKSVHILGKATHFISIVK